jgi:F-type H+-transporting ATPase subunit epsilon
MVSFWRQAGLSYLRYANLCAKMVRNCLKEPHKAKALERDTIQFNVSQWRGGKATRGGMYAACIQVISDLTHSPLSTKHQTLNVLQMRINSSLPDCKDDE